MSGIKVNGRSKAERNGRRGETFAAFYLRLTGWRILAQRAKTPRGEVDLLAKRGRTLCAVEVKWRQNARDLDMAIDSYRLQRVAAATQVLAGRYAQSNDDIRIDVLLLTPWRWPRRIKNAWQPMV